MTGREAVVYFVKCHHLGTIKSLFFNYTPSRYFAPYDLLCVHKNHVSSILMGFLTSILLVLCF